MTVWQIPIHSLRYPKSDRKTIERLIVSEASPLSEPHATGAVLLAGASRS
jgi:hypothetical protein